MSDNMFLDFSNVDVPSFNHLEPGQYRTKVSKVELEDFQGKNSQVPKKILKVTFTTKDDKAFTESFYLNGDTPDKTKKALGRLQYLHEALFGEKISASFTSYDEMLSYFRNKLMPAKNVPVINLVVSGEKQEDGRVYSRLGFADFIFPGADKDFVEKVFEVDSEEYKRVVKIKKTTPAGAAVVMSSAPVLSAATGAAVAAPWE